MRLLDISASYESIRLGLLGKEIDAFKADCHSKGKAAQELSENVKSDCIMPLGKLLVKQDIEFKAIVNQSRLILNDMQADN